MLISAPLPAVKQLTFIEQKSPLVMAVKPNKSTIVLKLASLATGQLNQSVWVKMGNFAEKIKKFIGVLFVYFVMSYLNKIKFDWSLYKKAKH